MLESRESDTLPRELPDEAAWVDLLQAGDDGAYERLVRTFGGRMLAVARRYVRDEEDARDVVQNAFCSVFKAIGTFRQEARLGTWLHRIVVNTALMHLREKRRLAEEPMGITQNAVKIRLHRSRQALVTLHRRRLIGTRPPDPGLAVLPRNTGP